jgi:hypothetical protein
VTFNIQFFFRFGRTALTVPTSHFEKISLFGKEVGFEVVSDSKVGFLFPTYIFLLINHFMSVSDVGIKRAVRAKLKM